MVAQFETETSGSNVMMGNNFNFEKVMKAVEELKQNGTIEQAVTYYNNQEYYQFG